MWQLSENTALLTLGSLSARVELPRPDAGLNSLAVLKRSVVEARLFCLQTSPVERAPQSLVDAYVRGADLVATYTQTAARLLRPQLYWRALADASPTTLGGIELIVSAQTSLLGVDSSLQVESYLPAGQVLVFREGGQFSSLNLQAGTVAIDKAPGVFLFRPDGVEWSYAELVFPTDFAGATLSPAPSATDLLKLTHRLFPEQLEKGVIRRGRLRGLFFPRADDEAATSAAYREFLASPVPLTT